MRILVSWLRELTGVPPGTDVEQVDKLASALHLTGFELAGVERPPALPPTLAEPQRSVVASALRDDVVIDVEVTSNRPDCLGMVGIAREVSTLADRPLSYMPSARLPRTQAHAESAGVLRVTIDAPELCPRYTAAIADVEVGASPDWLVARLAASGIRSINNIVDITNYVLMETGHPIHAFDLERLAGAHLRIRKATAGEAVTTLDGERRTLTENELVIADAERPQAVAGVMGGADSEVTTRTRVIALESAYFNPVSVRRTSRRLALSTEASYRFERGADPEAPPRALARAGELIEQIGAGKARAAWIDAYVAPQRPTIVSLRRARLDQVLGFRVPAEDASRILEHLGFGLEETAGEAWRVTVPSWRVDVAREIDLIEEVARHLGYGGLPAMFPALTVPPPPPDARLVRDRRLRDLMLAAGCSECVTFSFVRRETAQRYEEEGSLVTIANPLSESFAVMRPMLLPGLIDSLAHNRRREQRDVALFELATRFTREAGERQALGFAATGLTSELHWSGSARAADVFDAAGTVSLVCDAIGLDVRFAPATRRFLTSATSAEIVVVPAHETDEAVKVTPRVIGVIGQLEPAVAEAHGLPAREPVFVAELDLDAVVDWTDAGDRIRALPLPRFPSVVRDLSIVVPTDLPAATVRGTIRVASPPTLESLRTFDRYVGPGLPAGTCSLSLRFTFRSPERTLTEGEVQAAMDAIVRALAEKHGATIR